MPVTCTGFEFCNVQAGAKVPALLHHSWQAGDERLILVLEDLRCQASSQTPATRLTHQALGLDYAQVEPTSCMICISLCSPVHCALHTDEQSSNQPFMGESLLFCPSVLVKHRAVHSLLLSKGLSCLSISQELLFNISSLLHQQQTTGLPSAS